MTTVPGWVAPAWGRRSVTAARLARGAAARRAGRVALAAGALVAVVAGAWIAGAESGPPLLASTGPVAVWRTASGLALSFPFDHPLPTRDLLDPFHFNGSAAPGVGYGGLGTGGLVIGVHRHPPRFEGWFAVTRRSYPGSGVYHVEMAAPARPVSGPGAQGEAVFAVQTGTTRANGLINYVVVATNARDGRLAWEVGYAHGHVANARLEPLRRVSVGLGDRVLAITLTTDGRHSLSVWVGPRLVYHSTRLHLDIAPPYQPYLEVQSRGVPYTATFHDLWITASDVVTVKAPVGARVRLVGAGGATIGEGVARGGVARIRLPAPLAQGRARLVVDAGARHVTLGPFPYAGGDTLRVTGLPAASGSARRGAS